MTSFEFVRLYIQGSMYNSNNELLTLAYSPNEDAGLASVL